MHLVSEIVDTKNEEVKCKKKKKRDQIVHWGFSIFMEWKLKDHMYSG